MDNSLFQEVSLTGYDWTALVIFLAIVIGFAAWAKLSSKGSEDFFLAGRSMGWLIVMMSTFATLFSTISFVQTPGEAYSHGMGMWLFSGTYYLFLPIAIAVVLRFYFYTKIFSVYEYLEKRFNTTLRVCGSLTFILVKAVYSASIFFAASKVFSSLVGWNPFFTVIAVGLFTVAYSTTGGMKAVMLTDVVQGIVVILGIGAIAFVLLKAVGFDVAQVYAYSAQQGRGLEIVTKPEFYEFDMHKRLCFWMFLWAWLSPIGLLAMDQSTIQRLLASKGLKPATRAMYGNVLISIPLGLVLWFIGLGLYYYYNNGVGQLPSGISSDQVMGYFIRTELPTPLPGLIVAALLAALMSTIDSTMNSQANLIHRDVLIRFGIMKDGSKHEMPVCRALSLFFGLCGVALAVVFVISDRGSKTTVFETITVFGALLGGLPIAWAFIFGMLVPRVSAKAMLVSLIVGWVINTAMPLIFYYPLPPEDRIGFLWLGMPGTIILIILLFVLSFFWPNRKNLTNLTVWTIDKNKKGQGDEAYSETIDGKTIS